MPAGTASDHDRAPVAGSSRSARPPSEFAEQVPRLRRLAALGEDDPEREDLREELILAFMPVAERIAARYAAHSPGSREDLRQVAAMGVIQAVDRWSPERATGDVLGYLIPCVRGTILRHFRDRTWLLRVPRGLKELSVSVRQATGELVQQLGRAPRPSELAHHMDLDLEQVLEALQAEESQHAIALDAPGPGDEPALAERLGEDDGEFELVEDIEVLRPLLAELPARERRILLLRFYGGHTQAQIAEKVGVSQMHISRLLSRTLATLRHAMLDDGIPDGLPAVGA